MRTLEQKIEQLLKDVAVMKTSLNYISNEITEIRAENKENNVKIEQLSNKQAALESKLKLVEQKVENLNNKFAIPEKLLICVLTAIVTAVLALVLK